MLVCLLAYSFPLARGCSCARVCVEGVAAGLRGLERRVWLYRLRPLLSSTQRKTKRKKEKKKQKTNNSSNSSRVNEIEHQRPAAIQLHQIQKMEKIYREEGRKKKRGNIYCSRPGLFEAEYEEELPKKKGRTWPCPACTFRNTYSSSSCAMCHQGRFSSPSSLPSLHPRTWSKDGLTF